MPDQPNPSSQPPKPPHSTQISKPMSTAGMPKKTISLGLNPNLTALGIPKPAVTSGPRASPKMQVAVQNEIAVVTLLESRILDETNIAELGEQLMNLVQKQYMVKMILDLGEVKYLSSAVLRQFIALYKAIKAEKGDLKICRVRPEVREIFKITQLDKMIEIKDDLTSAINSFQKSGWGFLKR